MQYQQKYEEFMRYVPNNIEDKSIMDHLKEILENGLNNSHESMKNIVILVAFQIIIPAAIQFCCWAINAVEGYFSYKDTEDVSQIAAETQLSNNEQEVQTLGMELVAPESASTGTELV
jgi:hypothetical protein